MPKLCHSVVKWSSDGHNAVEVQSSSSQIAVKSKLNGS